MAKAILEFNLEDERELFEASYSGPAVHNALWELIQEVRSVVKHGANKLDAEGLQDVYKRLQEIYSLGEVE